MTPSDLTSQRSFRAEQADFSESVRSCEPIGLRSEESLFAVSYRLRHTARSSAPFLTELCVLCVSGHLCVKSFSYLFPATHYPLPTTRWFPA